MYCTCSQEGSSLCLEALIRWPNIWYYMLKLEQIHADLSILYYLSCPEWFSTIFVYCNLYICITVFVLSNQDVIRISGPLKSVVRSTCKIHDYNLINGKLIYSIHRLCSHVLVCSTVLWLFHIFPDQLYPYKFSNHISSNIIVCLSTMVGFLPFFQ